MSYIKDEFKKNYSVFRGIASGISSTCESILLLPQLNSSIPFKYMFFNGLWPLLMSILGTAESKQLQFMWSLHNSSRLISLISDFSGFPHNSGILAMQIFSFCPRQ